MLSSPNWCVNMRCDETYNLNWKKSNETLSWLVKLIKVQQQFSQQLLVLFGFHMLIISSSES